MAGDQPSGRGWHASPTHPGQLQYFDGTAWLDAFAPVDRPTVEAPLGRTVRYERIRPSRRGPSARTMAIWAAVLVGGVVVLLVAGAGASTVEWAVFSWFAIGTFGIAGSMRAARIDTWRGSAQGRFPTLWSRRSR